MSCQQDLVELSRQLKQERLFITDERNTLVALNEEVRTTAEELTHIAWVARQQKFVLEQLILGNRDATPQECYKQTNALETTCFVDGHKILSHHEAKFGEFLKVLRENPRLVAQCLVLGEGLQQEMMGRMGRLLMSSVYGNMVMGEDEGFVLQVLKTLVEVQVSVSSEPRRLLHKASCAFSVIFSSYTDCLHSAKLFLTAALHRPVMQLLMEDEWFFDIDPNRALSRFPTEERLRRFGQPGSDAYYEKTKAYREFIINKLVMLTERFIVSIRNNMHCFPNSLSCLISQIHHSVTKAGKVENKVVRSMCADLMFAFFICPAICDPEPYGITSDAPITHIANNNLMQVAQIIQVLALPDMDGVDAKNRDLYNKFDKEIVTSLLEDLLENSLPDTSGLVVTAAASNASNAATNNTTLSGSGGTSGSSSGTTAPPSITTTNSNVVVAPAPPCGASSSAAGSVSSSADTLVNRAAVLISHGQLTDLMNFLQIVLVTWEDESEDKKLLEEMMSVLPPVPHQQSQAGAAGGGSGTSVGSSSIVATVHSNNASPLPTPPNTPQSSKVKVRELRRLLTPDRHGDDMDSKQLLAVPTVDDVMVITLGSFSECPGMIPEHKVIEQESKKVKQKLSSFIPGVDDIVICSDVPLQEKRTRFSLSHDQDSIATSDNLEAISEAASSHSVGSDLENENDNLSDMVSANVSGRGTPNISGRDTPTSQAGSQSESAGGQEDREQQAPNLPVMVKKENRVDVTDRFGKFDIKSEIERDDTKSTVSDTWSTDVLASDSEPPESNQLERLEEVAEEMVRQNLLGVNDILEISETGSDAWSTDVLASDTSEWQAERLLELDQDDVASVISGKGATTDDTEASYASTGGASAIGTPGGVSAPGSGAIGGADGIRGQPAKGDHTPQAAAGSYSPDRGGFDTSLNSSISFRPILHNSPTKSLPQQERSSQWSSGAVPDFKTHPSSDQKAVNFVEPFKQHASLSSHVPLSTSSGDGVSAMVDDAVVGMGALSVETDYDAAGQSGDSMIASGGSTHSVSSIVENGAVIGMVGGNGNVDKNGSGGAKPKINKNHNHAAPSSKLRRKPPAASASHASPAHHAGKTDVAASGEMVNDEDVELTERQNSNIDALRLSQTVQLFDPLMQDSSSTDPPDLDLLQQQHRSLSDAGDDNNGCDNSVTDTSGGNDHVFSETRTTTVVTHITTNHTPKISIQASSMDGGAVKMLSGSPGVEQCNTQPEFKTPKAATSSLEASVESSYSNSGAPMDYESDSRSRSRTNSIDSQKNRVGDTAVREAHSGAHGDSPYNSECSEDEMKKKSSGGFFRTFKDRISKGTKRKTVNGDATLSGSAGGAGVSGGGSSGGGVSGGISGTDARALQRTEPNSTYHAPESSDDILAKYRRPPTLVATGGSVPQQKHGDDKHGEDEVPGTPAYDANNLEHCKAFLDAKRKLRLVLSTADFQLLPSMLTYHRVAPVYGRSAATTRDNDLVLMLKIQLAEAINLQDKDLIARLHETIRCLKQFDNEGVKKLVKSLRDDYRCRSSYIAYLVRCRQGLLSTQAHLQRLEKRIRRDKAICNKHFVSVAVRLFLQQKDKAMHRFIAEFQRLTVADEKTVLVENLLKHLRGRLEEDVAWQAATHEQIEEAHSCIERHVMSNIYTHAMYPNGDADLHRDRILSDHISKLCRVISVQHKDLRIPQMYHYECPWPAAQADIFTISAYKTPKDKVACVTRCSLTIMNLLSLASDKSVPAADDFMPVLIFVIIKANPANLLSTMQYVNSFYGNRITGEDQYWWMQFTSAIEFIKTMDYNA